MIEGSQVEGTVVSEHQGAQDSVEIKVRVPETPQGMEISLALHLQSWMGKRTKLERRAMWLIARALWRGWEGGKGESRGRHTVRVNPPPMCLEGYKEDEEIGQRFK